jgi:hypothetical protein
MRNMPYGLWYRAERDARRLPPSQPGPIGMLILIVLGILLVVSCASQGGFGIILAIACGAGLISGLTNK